MLLDSLIHKVFRCGGANRYEVLLDCAVLIGLSLLLVATGIGLRDPWPTAEPRFALIVRDMVTTGDWLIPRLAGDVYVDEPPLFFWLMAVALELSGSLRAAFLLPSLCSAVGMVMLIYDLARRLWGREIGLIAGISLLTTLQFIWEARQAQPDATLCFWTTLSFYGLLRHFLSGPHWYWYVIAWAAAGLGVITKSVGFLPILMLLPFALLRAPVWQPRSNLGLSWRWLLGPVAFCAAVSVWFLPMLLGAQHDPVLAAYRDEILVRQTIGRYTGVWHQRQPLWYFFIHVILCLWLPLTALLPWLVPHWRSAYEQRDLRIVLPACWIVLVVCSSLCTSQRAADVLPAVPVFALICAPYLHAVSLSLRAQRTLYVLASVLGGVCLLGSVYLLLRFDAWIQVIVEQGIEPQAPLLMLGAGTTLLCAWAHSQRGFLVFVATLTFTLLVVSFWINPVINDVRSGAAFIAEVQRRAANHGELGLFTSKEQFVLNLTRPVTHFAYVRRYERDQELANAARWVSAVPDRRLVVNEWGRQRCFPQVVTESLGRAHREKWYLIQGSALPECIARGDDASVYYYVPTPDRKAITTGSRPDSGTSK